MSYLNFQESAYRPMYLRGYKTSKIIHLVSSRRASVHDFKKYHANCKYLAINANIGTCV